MHVGIITYQTGHLKTWQILRKLQTKPYRVTLFAFPFKPRPQRRQIFQDRPGQLIELDIKDYCDRHDVGYVTVDGWEDEYAACFDYPSPNHHSPDEKSNEKPKVFLTCIAKIIPASFIEGRVILNAHPGLLPENRGLDAFKWSIINSRPVGVSLHAIDENIDQGTLLYRIKVPILPSDTLVDVANRSYETECDLQANFEHYLPELATGLKVTSEHPLSTKRVPDDLNIRLESIFQENKEILIKLSAE